MKQPSKMTAHSKRPIMLSGRPLLYSYQTLRLNPQAKMIQIKGLDHVVIRARNAKSMTKFYCDVLGCVVERELSPVIGLIQLRAGDSLIDIVAVEGDLGRMGGAAPEEGGHNMDHFCVRLKSFEEEVIRGHLERHGVVGSRLETRYGAEGHGPSIYIQDPEGNTIELKGPPN